MKHSTSKNMAIDDCHINNFLMFDTDKAITLVFDLGSIQETTNTEEAGLFGHLISPIFYNLLIVVVPSI